MSKQKSEQFLMYVGTYTRRESEGIYGYRMDPSTGALTLVSTTPGLENPSYLAVDAQRSFLYAVNESMRFAGQPGGAVSAFAINLSTGALTFLNQQPSHGTAPCHVVVDATGSAVLVANYGSGSAAVYPTQADGRLGEATDVVQHEGGSVHPRRQTGPHAHSITLDPDNRFAFIADLGLDKLMTYQLDLTVGKLFPNKVPWVKLHPGAGPRHCAFHPNGRILYVINEIDSTMTAFDYDAARGAFAEIQTLSTLPEGFVGRSTCADVHVAPSGRFVYGSNRGHDSIVIFAVDATTGKLTPVDFVPTQGKTPRNFALDPTGNYLYAANQDSDTIVSFRVNPDTGSLTPTGHVVDVSMPVCVRFL